MGKGRLFFERLFLCNEKRRVAQTRLLLSHSDCIRRLRILTVSTVGAVGLIRVKIAASPPVGNFTLPKETFYRNALYAFFFALSTILKKKIEQKIRFHKSFMVFERINFFCAAIIFDNDFKERTRYEKNFCAYIDARCEFGYIFGLL